MPSPNVSEDHQTKNANALVAKRAAVMVKDIEAREKLISALDEVIHDSALQKALSDNIKDMGIRSADKRIVEEIAKIVKC